MHVCVYVCMYVVCMYGMYVCIVGLLCMYVHVCIAHMHASIYVAMHALSYTCSLYGLQSVFLYPSLPPSLGVLTLCILIC